MDDYNRRHREAYEKRMAELNRSNAENQTEKSQTEATATPEPIEHPTSTIPHNEPIMPSNHVIPNETPSIKSPVGNHNSSDIIDDAERRRIEEELSLAEAQRLQSEFDAIDQVRAPDNIYSERLIGSIDSNATVEDAIWDTDHPTAFANPIPRSPISQATQLSQDYTSHVSPNALGGAFQSPYQYNEAHFATPGGMYDANMMHNTPAVYPPSTVDTPMRNNNNTENQYCPETYAAAQAAGIPVDPEEAALQAVIAQSLVDM